MKSLPDVSVRDAARRSVAHAWLRKPSCPPIALGSPSLAPRWRRRGRPQTRMAGACCRCCRTALCGCPRRSARTCACSQTSADDDVVWRCVSPWLRRQACHPLTAPRLASSAAGPAPLLDDPALLPPAIAAAVRRWAAGDVSGHERRGRRARGRVVAAGARQEAEREVEAALWAAGSGWSPPGPGFEEFGPAFMFGCGACRRARAGVAGR